MGAQTFLTLRMQVPKTPNFDHKNNCSAAKENEKLPIFRPIVTIFSVSQFPLFEGRDIQ